MQKLARIRQELLDTENTYVQTLQLINNEYILKMVQAKDPGIVAEKANLTCNWTTILNLHEDLLGDLEKPDNSIGNEFLKFADFMKLYSQYLDGYPKILETHGRLHKNKKFVQVMDGITETLQAQGTQGGTISNYLIQPVQRVPRYVMLLKEIRKYTFTTSDEYDKLTLALSKMHETAKYINEAKRKAEAQSTLFNKMGKITHLPKDFTLMVSHRALLKHGSLQEISTGRFKSMKTSDRLVYLLSDVLLWTSQKNEYKGHLNLSACSLDLGEGGTNFEITSAKAFTVFKGDNAEEWYHELEAQIGALKAARERKMRVKKGQMAARSRGTLPRGLQLGGVHEMIMETASPRSQLGSNEASPR